MTHSRSRFFHFLRIKLDISCKTLAPHSSLKNCLSNNKCNSFQCFATWVGDMNAECWLLPSYEVVLQMGKK